VIEELGGTVERSKSGRGLHVFVDGRMRDAMGRRDRQRGIELYCRDRAILLTGDLLREAAKPAEEQARALRALEATFPARTRGAGDCDSFAVDLGLIRHAGMAHPRALMIWFQLRCGDARSHLTLEEAIGRLLRFCPATVRNRRKRAERDLAILCEAGFAERVLGRFPGGDCTYIRPVGRDRLAKRFGSGPQRDLPILIEQARPLTPKRLFAHAVQLARASRADRPAPMTRRLRSRLSGVSRQTQYRTERQAGSRAIPQLRRLKRGESLPRERSHRLRVVDGMRCEQIGVAVELETNPNPTTAHPLRDASRPGVRGLQDSGMVVRYVGAGELERARAERAALMAANKRAPDYLVYDRRIAVDGRTIDLWIDLA
jgi:hypothetical protein